MKKKEDLRIVKTKAAIKNAFFELLEEKPLEKISVADITARSMINRGTFYLHYKDKFDLMEAIENEVLEGIDAAFSLISEESLQKAYEERRPMPHIIPLLCCIEENHQFFALIARESADIPFYQKIAEKYFYRFTKLMHMDEDEIWDEYRKNIMLSTVSSIFSTWIGRGMKETKEEMAEWMTKMIMTTFTRDC